MEKIITSASFCITIALLYRHIKAAISSKIKHHREDLSNKTTEALDLLKRAQIDLQKATKELSEQQSKIESLIKSTISGEEKKITELQRKNKLIAQSEMTINIKKELTQQNKIINEMKNDFLEKLKKSIENYTDIMLANNKKNQIN